MLRSIAVLAGIFSLPTFAATENTLEIWARHGQSPETKLTFQTNGPQTFDVTLVRSGKAPISATLDAAQTQTAVGLWGEPGLTLSASMTEKRNLSCAVTELHFRMKSGDRQTEECVSIVSPSSVLKFYSYVSDLARNGSKK